MAQKLSSQRVKLLVNYWLNSSIEDMKTSKVLFTNKRYAPCLFYMHISLEKLFKALIVQNLKIYRHFFTIWFD